MIVMRRRASLAIQCGRAWRAMVACHRVAAGVPFERGAVVDGRAASSGAPKVMRHGKKPWAGWHAAGRGRRGEDMGHGKWHGVMAAAD